jgi:hypothetical protein
MLSKVVKRYRATYGRQVCNILMKLVVFVHKRMFRVFSVSSFFTIFLFLMMVMLYKYPYSHASRFVKNDGHVINQFSFFTNRQKHIQSE